jgi:hypothetical protein
MMEVSAIPDLVRETAAKVNAELIVMGKKGINAQWICPLLGFTTADFGECFGGSHTQSNTAGANLLSRIVKRGTNSGGWNYMRRALLTLALLQALLLVMVYPLYAEESVREIGIDDILFAPSSFVSAIEDDLTLSGYIRTRTKEGEVPEDFNDTMDASERFLAIRAGRFGLTAGWLPDVDETILEPSVLSIDYKYPFPYVVCNDMTFAAAIKYSTRKPPGSDMRSALLDSGVFSIIGITSKPFFSRFTIYGGVSANYIYLDARSDELTDLWRPVPFVGIMINFLLRYNASIVSELNRGRLDDSEDAVWTWHLGASIGL